MYLQFKPQKCSCCGRGVISARPERASRASDPLRISVFGNVLRHIFTFYITHVFCFFPWGSFHHHFWVVLMILVQGFIIRIFLRIVHSPHQTNFSRYRLMEVVMSMPLRSLRVLFVRRVLRTRAWQVLKTTVVFSGLMSVIFLSEPEAVLFEDLWKLL